jgi:type IVB pilus formation R64 PilN family outer membrane protein
LPVQVITREAYLAGVSTTTDEYSQTTQLTPGEVATGFSMVVIPHILDRREVILQYNVTFSSLDELEEFSSGDVTVQLPKVSTRSFSQRVTMHIGQTLVLGGFEQEQRFDSKGFGFVAGGKSGQYGKSVIVVTIDVADAEV